MNRNEKRALKKEPRYRVLLELKDGEVMPYGPVAARDFCERICEMINKQILRGKSNPNNVTGAVLSPVLSN